MGSDIIKHIYQGIEIYVYAETSYSNNRRRHDLRVICVIGAILACVIVKECF